MLHTFTPRSASESLDRTNLATGPFAEASLRAWSVVQFARQHHHSGEAAGMAQILCVIQTHVVKWPVPVQRFLFRQLATIGEATPQPSEVA